MKVFLAMALIAISLMSTFAVGQNRQVNIFTFEDASCDAWKKSSDNKLLRAQYEFWIRGFVSGNNYATPTRQVGVGTLPGADALYSYIDDYCGDYPQSSFVGAAIKLVEQLRQPVAATKGTSKPPATKPAAAK